MLWFTGYLLPSNKDIISHGHFHVKRYCDPREWFDDTARDSAENRT
jgi:hypothetical protein